MSVVQLLTRPSGFLPIAMSAAALGMVVWYVSIWGTTPQPDESGQARLWQLLMAAQLPVIGYFALTWLPRAPRHGMMVLALQSAAALVAAAPVLVLGF
ncbi:MAG TPA: hypothetical protein VJ506_02270 [Candidatus Limnocylindrales bacterium]|nr:hypothetical protein [Candidatus Limnocylindrales bacterium]